MENLQDVFKQTSELLSRKQLKEKDLVATPITLPAVTSYPINAGDVTFSIGAGAALIIQLFNDENDIDEDGIVGSTSDAGNFNTGTEAYLKYTGNVTAKANASGSLQDIGFNISSALDLKSIFYKKHPNESFIGDAYIADIINFSTIFKWADVAGLQPGDALCFKAAATVQANLKISWSNILTQSLSSLTKNLPSPLTLDIKLSPSLFAAFTFSITDVFNYVIKKTDDNTCLVSINKTKNTCAAISAGAKIEAGFSKPDELKEQLNVLFDATCKSLLGYNRADIDSAIKKTQEGNAGKTEKDIVDTLLSFFNLQTAIDSINELAAKWKTIEGDIKKSFESLAQAHTELSFSYEYSFMEENKEFLSVNIPTALLQNYHSSLLRFNTTTLLNDIRKGLPVTVDAYFNQKTIDIKKTWGFGLNLFGIGLLGKDLVEYKPTIRTNINNRSQVTLDYSRGYNWNLGKGQGKWMGQLVAGMDHYSNYPSPALNEFDYSLQLSAALTDPKVGLNDLREYLDTAVLWGAVKQMDTQKLTDKHYEAIAGKEVLMEWKLEFSPVATKILIAQIAGNGWKDFNKNYLAKAMAGALKYLPQFPLRAAVASREETYTNLWQNFLRYHDEELTAGDFAGMAAAAIEDMPEENNLAVFEKNEWRGFDYYFAGVIYRNPDLYDSLHDFILGLTDLQGKIDSGAPYKNFGKSYSLIQGMFTQIFYMRTLGAFLLHYIKDNGLQNEVKNIFTISYGDGDNEAVINFCVV